MKDAPVTLITQEIPRVLGALCQKADKYTLLIILQHHIILK